ncbi:hypothetical protein GCM10008992_26880 [Halorubrum aquaticum]
MSRRKALGTLTAGIVSLSGCNSADDTDDGDGSSSIDERDGDGGEDPVDDDGGGAPAADDEVAGFDAEGYGIEFDRVVNAVDDLGMDPTGEEPIDDALDDAIETGTRIEFPPGDYTVTEEPPTKPARSTSRLGLVGLGESQRDVQFHFPTAGEREDGFWFVNQAGGEDVLLANFSIQLSDDLETSVSIRLDTNDNGIAEDLEWLGFIPAQIQSKGSLLRMNVSSRNGATTDGVNVVRRVTMGRQGSYMGGHAADTGTTPGSTFMRHTPNHVGELRLEDVHFEQCGHNAVRSMNNPGVVTVKGGYFLNCDVSTLRFQGGGHPTKTSLIEGVHIEQDHSKLNRTAGTEPHEAMGILVDSYEGHSGLVIRDCDIEYKDVSVATENAGALWGIIRCTNTGASNPGGFTVENCRIRNDTRAQTFWIQSTNDGVEGPPGVKLKDLDVTITADRQARGSVCAIMDGRDGSSVSNCCIQAPNGNFHGITVNGCSDVVVEDSNINVNGFAISMIDSDGDTRNISVNESCDDTTVE